MNPSKILNIFLKKPAYKLYPRTNCLLWMTEFEREEDTTYRTRERERESWMSSFFPLLILDRTHIHTHGGISKKRKRKRKRKPMSTFLYMEGRKEGRLLLAFQGFSNFEKLKVSVAAALFLFFILVLALSFSFSEHYFSN